MSKLKQFSKKKLFVMLIAIGCVFFTGVTTAHADMEMELSEDEVMELKRFQAKNDEDKYEEKFEEKEIGDGKLKNLEKQEFNNANKALTSKEVVTKAELEGKKSSEKQLDKAKATDVEDAGLSELVIKDEAAEQVLVEAEVVKPAEGEDNTTISIGDTDLVEIEVSDEKAQALNVEPELDVKETEKVLLTTPAVNEILDQAVNTEEIIQADEVVKEDDKIILKKADQETTYRVYALPLEKSNSIRANKKQDEGFESEEKSVACSDVDSANKNTDCVKTGL